MVYGKVIASLRKEKKMNQHELADRLKISKSSISMYETEKRAPDISTIIRLADFFDVSVDYLLGTTAERTRAEEQLILSSENEKDLVRRYRNLDAQGKAEVLGYIRGYAAHCNSSLK